MNAVEDAWYWVKIGDSYSPAIHSSRAANGWTNLDTWEDFNHEVTDYIKIPLPHEITGNGGQGGKT